MTARAQTIVAAMREAGRRAREADVPERYRWTAVWWRLHARESADPVECRRAANGLMRLYTDMLARPGHYKIRPPGKTDWEWSGLKPLVRVTVEPLA